MTTGNKEPSVATPGTGRHRNRRGPLQRFRDADHFHLGNRNIPVDTLRGIACIFLVTFHVIGDTSSAGIQVADDSAFRYYTESVVYLRMPLFTLLSGLVYAWRPLADPRLYPDFMRKKARRLLVPYVIFVPVLGFTQMVAPGVNGEVEFEPVNWLLTSLGPYWFLLTTFWMFAVVALLDSYRLLDSRLVFGTLFGVVLAVVVVFRTEGFDFLQLGQALSLFPFFLAGMAFHRFRLIPRRTAGIATVTVVLIALVVVVQLAVRGTIGDIDSRHSILGIALGMVFPLAFLAWKLQSHLLAWIGGYSSGIFLLHSFVVGFFRAALTAVGVESDTPLFILAALGGLFGSIFGVWLLRKITIGKVAVGKIILGEKTRKKK